jgi:hypothetical protein
MPEHRGRDLDLGAGKSAKGVDLCHIPAIKLNDYPRLTRAVLTHAGTESVIGCAVLFQRRPKGVVRLTIMVPAPGSGAERRP